ncbi:1-deoxy-D-xylulose 5-phosphate reductoisomerase [Betaproteobacteria bacterium UKL13-2]|jgi:1-deoxy-D-xylulose-5-phosphate reductoisomerase|nr:1-deoxy-D-xylulose 5-phosphate reductoisomerase [Betaproteobacteria bacterium UKL13-2]
MSRQQKIKNISVLGATGSIGLNTLDVIARHPDRFRAFALSAATKVAELAALCEKFSPRFAVMTNAEAADKLRAQLRQSHSPTEVLSGAEALEEVAAHADVDAVMAAIVGAAGLKSSLAAAKAGKTVLLANKEALVMSGGIFMKAVRDSGSTLLPIDSEHNAIFQSLPRHFGQGLDQVGVQKIILTASGGPFRTRPIDTLSEVTPDEACAHPKWVMGRKISVDSATMMNKGLEVIEAHWLFNAAPEMIDVVIHPQSVVHSMVSYRDGSVIAQLGNPDMRTPIAFGLGFPDRIDGGVRSLDLAKIGKLEFEPLDLQRFPCVRLAYEAMRRGGTAPAILNAANEVAVEAFLNNQMRFVDIPRVLEDVLSRVPILDAATLEQVLVSDDEARSITREAIALSRTALIGQGGAP